MNRILIHVDDKSYSIDAAHVVEIVPLVQLESFASRNAGIAGGMMYRGQIVPVIDLCLMLAGRKHQKKFSTRILIVQQEAQTIGLVAENLTDLESGSEQPVQKLDLQMLLDQCL